MTRRSCWSLIAAAFLLGSCSCTRPAQQESRDKPSQAEPTSTKPAQAGDAAPSAGSTLSGYDKPVQPASVPNSGLQQVEISYTWEGGTNRCSGATARLNGTVIGEARSTGIGGDENSGYYVEVEENAVFS